MTGEKAQHQTTCLLAVLSWGTVSPTTVRYCTLPDALVVPSLGTFVGEKNLDISLPVNHAGIEDRPGRMRGPSSLPPFSSLISGYPHPPVSVSIYSYNIDDQILIQEFTGDLGTGKRSPGGKKGLFEFDLVGCKSRLVHLRVSMPANFECANIFAGHVCQVNMTGSILTGSISAVSTKDNRITVSSSGLDPQRYSRGTLNINGAKYLIKTVNNNVITTYKQPNPNLVGQAYILFPGCRKRLQDCQFWNNVARFNGLGYAMPAKNPSYES